MKPGDYVIDGDDDDPDLAVVVHRPDATIDEVMVGDSDRTVAVDNPDYDADEPAVVVAFVESGLDEHWPGWTDRDPGDLYDGAQSNGVTLYTFPESRLSPVSEAEARAFFGETSVDLLALRSRLEGAEWEIDLADSGALVASKLDEEYHIHPTGEVEGDGRVRKPLENIVSQYR